ncbi:MAG: hypothetical protein J5940_07465 [Clostridia bacterium]|nr:hypothetical protein [Clostridia bacterium]
MMIFRYSLRNVIRLYKQTILYALIVILVASSLVTGLLVYSAAERAIDRLNDEYLFIATLVPIDKPKVDGTSEIQSKLTYHEFLLCYDSELCAAYNVSPAGKNMFIAGDDCMFEVPTGEPDGNPSELWKLSSGCPVEVTANLDLERLFLSKGAHFASGGGFTNDGYIGNKCEIIVPKDAADKYGIEVGDMITVGERDLTTQLRWAFYGACEVVGIYEVGGNVYAPAYITYQYFMERLDVVARRTAVSQLYRADYVLHGRGEFEKFVYNAKEAGLDFSEYTLKFNNSDYDRILTGLNNIKSVIIIVVAVVSAIGAGLFVLFNFFFINSRKRECETLRCLGMRKLSIFACFLIEVAVIAAAVAPIGALIGDSMTGVIFDYVNERALETEPEEDDGYVSFESELYLPLTKKVDITVSKDIRETTEKSDFIPVSAKKEGYSRVIELDSFISCKIQTGETFRDVEATDPVELRLLAVENLYDTELFDLSIDEDVSGNLTYVFVPEGMDLGALKVYIHRDLGRFMHFNYNVAKDPVDETQSWHDSVIYIAGTYKPNDLCDEKTLLIDYDLARRYIQQLDYCDFYISPDGTVLDK